MPHVVRRPGLVSGASLAILLALAHLVNDALTAVLGVLLPTLQTRLGAGTITLAVLVAVFSASSSVTQPMLGTLADRFGHRLVAAAGVALAAVALSLIGVAGTTPALLVLLTLGGLGSAALHPTSTSIVGATGHRRPGLAVGLFTAGGMAGFAVGPVVILALIARFGLGATPWLMLPGLGLAILVYTLLPDWEPHRHGLRQRTFDRQRLLGQLGLLTVVEAQVGLAFLTFTNAIPLWLVTDRHLGTSAPYLGWTLAVFSVAAAAGAIAGGAAAPRLGVATTAATSIIAAAFALSATLLLPAGPAMLAAVAVGGMLLYVNQPLLVVAAQYAVPEAPAAEAGVVLGLGSGVASLLYIGVGVLQDALGIGPAIATTFALLLPAGVIAARALRV